MYIYKGAKMHIKCECDKVSKYREPTAYVYTCTNINICIYIHVGIWMCTYILEPHRVINNI